jgi:hypothetical protein
MIKKIFDMEGYYYETSTPHENYHQMHMEFKDKFPNIKFI